MAEEFAIAQIQRIVGKHTNNRRVELGTVKIILAKAAADKGGTMESADYARIREQLQSTLGLSIGQVLELAR